MLVYRIRNKHTGLFLVWLPSPAHEGHWSETGQFWKRIDTAKKHIVSLMHTWKSEVAPSGLYWRWVRGSYCAERKGVFEIVINDISVRGEKTIPAEDVVGEYA